MKSERAGYIAITCMQFGGVLSGLSYLSGRAAGRLAFLFGTSELLLGPDDFVDAFANSAGQ